MSVPDRKTLRVVQISDCHVAGDPVADYRGEDAARNLASLIGPVRAWRPELLLLTGDVSEDGSAASYERVAALLDQIDAPVHALPGNHDRAEAMQRVFPQGPWSGPHVVERQGWGMILLDSTAPGRVSGFLGRNGVEDFRASLLRTRVPHLLVALHHQPLPVGSPWIDRYPLKEPEAFFEVLDSNREVRCVLWGHIHQDFRAERDGVLLLGTPSSAVNSFPETERFTPDPSGPCCRWLELGADGRVEDGLLHALPS